MEHYYQAQKFGSGPEGGNGVDDSDNAATAVLESIAAAESPEEAARIGRLLERTSPMLVRQDWASAKVGLFDVLLPRHELLEHSRCMLVRLDWHPPKLVHLVIN